MVHHLIGAPFNGALYIMAYYTMVHHLVVHHLVVHNLMMRRFKYSRKSWRFSAPSASHSCRCIFPLAGSLQRVFQSSVMEPT